MKKVLILLLLGFFVSPLLAQKQERFNEEEEQTTVSEETEEEVVAPKPLPRTPAKKSDFWSRTRFGGNFGAGFGNQFSYVNVSPRMYYLATEKLWLGTGVTFIWSKDKYYPPPFDEQFVYGLNFSAQYLLFGPLFVQAEYEPLSFELVSLNPISGEYIEERIWAQGLLLGGGISQPIGDRGAFFASVLYNVTWTRSTESYYGSPWVFRVGFGL